MARFHPDCVDLMHYAKSEQFQMNGFADTQNLIS